MKRHKRTDLSSARTTTVSHQLAGDRFRALDLENLRTEEGKVPRIRLARLVHVEVLNDTLVEGTGLGELLERALGKVNVTLLAAGALVDDTNLDALAGLLVAELDELSTLRTVVPVLDHSTNVARVLWLPAATTVTALGVLQVVRGVPGDLDVVAPQLERIRRNHRVRKER